jgi:putative membrane protein
MLSFIIRTAISAFALLVIANVSNGTILVKGFTAAVIAAFVLGLANAVVKPILQWIAETLTCVLSCVTLGLSSLILSWLINAFLFYQVGNLLNGFEVKGFWPAMWGALALSVVNALATVFIDKKDKDE